jgi:broad specificity phosphatase PhoE
MEETIRDDGQWRHNQQPKSGRSRRMAKTHTDSFSPSNSRPHAGRGVKSDLLLRGVVEHGTVDYDVTRSARHRKTAPGIRLGGPPHNLNLTAQRRRVQSTATPSAPVGPLRLARLSPLHCRLWIGDARAAADVLAKPMIAIDARDYVTDSRTTPFHDFQRGVHAATERIDAALATGRRVLVVCHRGVNCSSALVVAYAVGRGMPMQLAMDAVDDAKTAVDPAWATLTNFHMRRLLAAQACTVDPRAP